MLINGQWEKDWLKKRVHNEQGRFVRPPSVIRNWITPDGSPGPTGQGGYKAETGRYHLYVALLCPWACRALMARNLLGLENQISASITHPVISEEGWRFGGYPDATEDHLFNEELLQSIYLRHDSNYTGMVSVPVLWDKQSKAIVNNESADILRMLNDGFAATATMDLAPADLREEIDKLNRRYYEMFNNGVYKAGFATSQQEYETAVDDVFLALDEIEQRLADHSYIIGDQICETDIRLFVTLIRFDAAYHGIFKCNLQRIVDSPKINTYLKRIYHLPGVAETVSIDHIKQGYYSLLRLNPNGIVPKGPLLDLG